jgi:hypothetical protein
MWEPLVMAEVMLVGNSGWFIILLCKWSLRYSAHLLPPCPSKIPKIWMLGQFCTCGCLLVGWITLRIMAMRSSLYCRTRPTLVLAENPLTEPNALLETLLFWKLGKPWFALDTVPIELSLGFYSWLVKNSLLLLELMELSRTLLLLAICF